MGSVPSDLDDAQRNWDRSFYDKRPSHPPVSKVNDQINLSRFSRFSKSFRQGNFLPIDRGRLMGVTIIGNISSQV
jgi:hypothetical protein